MALASEARRSALRLALATSAGFAIAEVRGEALPFLAPLLAAQLLAPLGRAPTLAQGLGFAFFVAVASLIALYVATLLIDFPAICLLVLALVFYFCFLFDVRGKGGPLPGLLLITTAATPVMVLQSPALGAALAALLAEAGLTAVLLVWAAHAAFPPRSARSVFWAYTLNGLQTRSTIVFSTVTSKLPSAWTP